jgi:hypothetical protein
MLQSGSSRNKPHYSNRNSENYDDTRSNFRSRRFSNQYDEDDNRGRGRGRPFRSRFRHDEDDGQDYSRSQRYDKDILPDLSTKSYVSESFSTFPLKSSLGLVEQLLTRFFLIYLENANRG